MNITVKDGSQKMSNEVQEDTGGQVFNLVARRKIRALNKNIQELTEVTTLIKSTMQGLSKYNHLNGVRYRVNDLFVLYQEMKNIKNKKLELLERLKNEQKELEG